MGIGVARRMEMGLMDWKNRTYAGDEQRKGLSAISMSFKPSRIEKV